MKKHLITNIVVLLIVAVALGWYEHYGWAVGIFFAGLFFTLLDMAATASEIDRANASPEFESDPNAKIIILIDEPEAPHVKKFTYDRTKK